MNADAVPGFIENLFSVARLYGWCEQVNEGVQAIEEMAEDQSDTVCTYVMQQLSSAKVDKEAAILSLVILHKRKKPLKQLFELTYKTLTGRLHVNDFPFLIRHFFDGVVPLPRSLAYDITEKLFFSVDWIFNKLVDDFRRVPFRNAEPIVFYLMLQNCRVDLNTQNKELVCIILTHIEVRLPDPILDDIISYLEANVSFDKKWLEQRKIIAFEREPKPETKPEGDTVAAPKESTEAEPPIQKSIPKETTDRRIRKSNRAKNEPRQYSRPAETMFEGKKPETTSERPVFHPPKPQESNDREQTVQKPADSYSPSERPQVFPPSEQVGRSSRYGQPAAETPVESEDSATPKPHVEERREKRPSRRAPPEIVATGAEEEKKSAAVRYGQFMEGHRERGILLSRLDPRRWLKRRENVDLGKEVVDTEQQKEQLSGGKAPRGTRKWLKWVIWAVIGAALVSLLLLVFSTRQGNKPAGAIVPAGKAKKQTETSNGSSARSERSIAGGKSAESEIATPSPASGQQAASVRFQFEVSGNSIIWHVMKGDTLYDVYRYLHSAPPTTLMDPRLRKAGRLSWEAFLAHVEQLNQTSANEHFNLIFPRDQYVLAK